MGYSVYVRLLQSTGGENGSLLLTWLPTELPTELPLSVRLLRTAARTSSCPLQQHSARVLRWKVN